MSTDEERLLPRFCECTGNPCGTDVVPNDEPGCACRQCLLWCREELLRRWQEMDRFRTENQRLTALIEKDFAVTRFHYEQGKPVEMSAKGAALVAFAAECRHFLGEAKNYVEIRLGDDLGQLLMTIQKLESPTPHELRKRAEADIAALRSEFSDVVQDIPVRGDETFGSAVRRIVTERNASVERLAEYESLDTPWPLTEVLRRLAEAADHLLRDHDCDAHWYEGVGRARDAARAIVRRVQGVDQP